MFSWEQLENEYNRHYDPYDNEGLYVVCDMCNAETIDLCICDSKGEE